MNDRHKIHLIQKRSIGNLGADPEVRYAPNGNAITSIRVATSETWKDKQTGEKQERTEWHKITLFTRLGEIAAQFLKKGSRVYVEGSLRTNKWQDQSGNDRYTTDIIASSMQMLDGKGAGGSAQFDSAPPAENRSNVSNSSPVPAMAEEEFDDDIPF